MLWLQQQGLMESRGSIELLVTAGKKSNIHCAGLKSWAACSGIILRETCLWNSPASIQNGQCYLLSSHRLHLFQPQIHSPFHLWFQLTPTTTEQHVSKSSMNAIRGHTAGMLMLAAINNKYWLLDLAISIRRAPFLHCYGHMDEQWLFSISIWWKLPLMHNCRDLINMITWTEMLWTVGLRFINLDNQTHSQEKHHNRSLLSLPHETF